MDLRRNRRPTGDPDAPAAPGSLGVSGPSAAAPRLSGGVLDGFAVDVTACLAGD